eukprot:1158455-Pelagomonas_calceolata.AAC.1
MGQASSLASLINSLSLSWNGGDVQLSALPPLHALASAFHLARLGHQGRCVHRHRAAEHFAQAAGPVPGPVRNALDAVRQVPGPVRNALDAVGQIPGPVQNALDAVRQ